MALNYSADVGQPDARAGELGVRMQALKDPEQSARITHVESHAIVADIKQVFPGFRPFDSDLDVGWGAIAGVFDRIGEEIGPDLANHGGIGLDLGELGHTPLDVTTGCLGLQLIDGLLDEVVHVHRGDAQRSPAHVREA